MDMSTEGERDGERRRERWIVAGLVVAALLLRLAAAVLSGILQGNLQGDEPVFVLIAGNLAAGIGYTMDGIHPTAARPPAYPLLVAGILKASGGSIAVVRLVNVLLGAVVVWLVFRICTR